MRPSKWEIWYAKVAYEDDPTQIKKLHFLIIDDRVCYILSFKITSRAPRLNFPGEYKLVKWSEAGLHKPSTVRTSKRLRMIETDFVYKIGRLHPVDILGIIRII